MTTIDELKKTNEELQRQMNDNNKALADMNARVKDENKKLLGSVKQNDLLILLLEQSIADPSFAEQVSKAIKK